MTSRARPTKRRPVLRRFHPRLRLDRGWGGVALFDAFTLKAIEAPFTCEIAVEGGRRKFVWRGEESSAAGLRAAGVFGELDKEMRDWLDQEAHDNAVYLCRR